MSRYENHNLEREILPFIFKERTEEPSGGMFGSSNWHENLEILRVSSGDGAVSSNGHVMPLSAGDVVVFNHNHLHAVASGKVRLRYHYLIIDRAFCLSNGLDTSKIEFESRIYDERVGKHIDELIEAYAIPESDRYRPILIRSIVLRLIYILSRDHAKPEDSAEGERSLSYVKNAIAYIHSSYDKDFSLDDAADFVGINKCYLSREFHKYTGYPFVAYVNRTRCKAASELLKDGRFAISDVAARCGFKNKSYFAKNFKRYIGMLPGEYRANAK